MKLNCLSCGHTLDLHDAYDDYQGQVKCFICGALLDVLTHDGQVKSVRMSGGSRPAAAIATIATMAISTAGTESEKGDSPHLCEAPSGPFRQMGTVPFSGAARSGLRFQPPLQQASRAKSLWRVGGQFGPAAGTSVVVAHGDIPK